MIWHTLTHLLIPAANAQIFNGGGLQAGLAQAAGIIGITSGDPREVIIRIIGTVLSFAALIAVIMIIIAGFYLVLSLGNDDNKDKAKKIIYYTLIGLLVLLFARIIVSIITVWLFSEVRS